MFFTILLTLPYFSDNLNRKERKQIMTNRRNVAGGVTLVEILVVIALLGILAVVATPSAKTYFANLTLRIATNAIKQQLILAKTRAMGDPNVHCGVYFDSSVTPNQTRPFMDTTTFYQYTGTDLAYMPVYTLPKNVTISVGGTGSSKVIVFRGDGSAYPVVSLFDQRSRSIIQPCVSNRFLPVGNGSLCPRPIS